MTMNISIGGLEELEDDVLDILTDVAGLGQRRGIDNREGNLEHLRQRLGEERFARSGGTDQQDVRLLDLNLARPLEHLDPFVVLIDGDGQLLLRLFLADDIFVEEGFDLGGPGERRAVGCRLLLRVVTDDLDADVDALIADVDSGSGDQFFDFILAFATEAAAQSVIPSSHSAESSTSIDKRIYLFPRYGGGLDSGRESVKWRHIEVCELGQVVAECR